MKQLIKYNIIILFLLEPCALYSVPESSFISHYNASKTLHKLEYAKQYISGHKIALSGIFLVSAGVGYFYHAQLHHVVIKKIYGIFQSFIPRKIIAEHHNKIA